MPVNDVHAPDLVQAFHRGNPQALGPAAYIRTLGVVVTPQLMSSRLSNNSTIPTLTTLHLRQWHTTCTEDRDDPMAQG
jgi:hypothetical protein